MSKPIIYQLLPRLFGNTKTDCIANGTIEQNGVGKLNDLNAKTLRSIRQLGATHVWLTGVIEHATQTDYSAFGITPDNPYVVKGRAGSPYAIKDYYDIDPDIAVSVPDRMKEFEAAVGRIHRADMKVIIDFVPNHVARQYHSDVRPADAPTDLGADDDTSKFFDRDNNFYYIPGQGFAPSIDLGQGDGQYVEFPARATGNDCFSPYPGVNDWYETVKLNYGFDPGNHSLNIDPIPSTWTKMLHILLYWASKGIDGFRCDMAHMVPIEFWHWAIAKVKDQYPGIIFIAEIYDVNLYWPYIHTGGFDYLYDKVNLYDTLRAIQTAGCPASALTGCWQRLGDMEPHMLNFLENHDEQRFASPQYAGNAMLVEPSLVVAATIGRGAMMIYAGQELGEQATDAEGFSGFDGRTTIFDYWSIPTLRQWLASGSPALSRLTPEQRRLRSLYSTLLNLCDTEPAISAGAFFDLMYANYSNSSFDPCRQFAYLRHLGGDTLLIVVNFADRQADISLNIPAHALECAGIEPGHYSATNLLSGQPAAIDFTAQNPTRISIPTHGAVILKKEKKLS